MVAAEPEQAEEEDLMEADRLRAEVETEAKMALPVVVVQESGRGRPDTPRFEVAMAVLTIVGKKAPNRGREDRRILRPSTLEPDRGRPSTGCFGGVPFDTVRMPLPFVQVLCQVQIPLLLDSPSSLTYWELPHPFSQLLWSMACPS
jgi:hypothetical protein